MRRFFTLVSILALAAAAPAAAYQESGPVVHVADGDTFDVDLGTTERIRLLGVNANEIGECHAATATARLTQLIDGKTVTLEADDPNVQLRGRLARWVSTGSTDVGEILLREGLALLFPHPTETARLDDYRAAAAVGRASGQGLWNSDACGIGPSQNADISVNLRWDAEGNDQTNINGEWIDIVNRSNSALSLNGWQVRDSALSFYEFPPAASVPSNGYLRVHIGEGSDTPTKLYWGLSDPLFDNSVGDGAFLLDPDGDIRASFEYPCAGSCTDPRGVDLSMEVNYDAPGDDQVNPNGEWVKIKNTGGAAIDLFGLAVVTYPYAYHFELGDSLGAEQVLTIYVGQGSDSTLTRYWGKSSGILDNGGDRIGVERSDGVILLEHSWPVASPPTRGCALAVAVPGDSAVTILSGDPASGLVPSDEVAAQSGARSIACGDFNGDGNPDVAVGYPRANVDSKGSAGIIRVAYGSDSGLPTSATQIWHQNSSGIAGVAEAGDQFGAALTVGDFDGDGKDDLAVGVPGEALGTKTASGMLNVIYGTKNGLASAGNQAWHQNSSGIAGVAEAGDQFGAALTAG